MQRILQESHADSARLLVEYRPQLDALAEALLKHETLEKQEILKVTGLPRSPRLHDRPISIHAARAPPSGMITGRESVLSG